MYKNYDVSIRYQFGRYEVYVNDEFWATCEDRNEVEEEIKYISSLEPMYEFL